MKKTINLFLRVWLLSLFIPSSLFSQISNYYVKAGGTGNGTSWDSPLDRLPALGGVLNNVHIYIAEGDYTLSDPGLGSYNYNYIGNDVLIQGGFPSTATGRDLSGYNPEFYISRIIKDYDGGFILVNATASGVGTFDYNKLNIKGVYFNSINSTVSGNLINNKNVLPQYYQLKVEECQIHDSYASDAFFSLSDLVTDSKVTHWFHNNKFYRNRMIDRGPFKYNNLSGGVKVLLSGNLIGEGSAVKGTGFFAENTSNNSRFYIIGNVFSCGVGSSDTGGVFLSDVSSVVIKNNAFLGNKTKLNGGAIQAMGISGLEIKDNYFVQNGTIGPSSGSGGAIYVSDIVDVTSVVPINNITGNFFYENKLDASGSGSAIYLAGDTNSPFDIKDNVFAYNKATLSDDQAAIEADGNTIHNISHNIFYGNTNADANPSNNLHLELKVNDLSNVSGVIAQNKFQLSSEAQYSNHELYPKIMNGANTVGDNRFNTVNADIAGVQAGDYTIDCYTGSVGCFKNAEIISNVSSKASKFGVSMFKSQNVSWPQKDFSSNDVNNGIMVLTSKSKPMVITRVQNPGRTLGNDPELKGAIAYDTEQKCLMLFDGDKWDCIAMGCDKTIYDVLENIKASMNIP